MARLIYWDDTKKAKAIEAILYEIANGKSVRSILDNANREEFPSWVTFNEWLNDSDELVKQYARACEMRAAFIFEEILTIADSQENDISLLPDGTEVTNHNAIQRNRLQIDARKWALSKMNPKKYGDKIDVNHSGEISDKKITVKYNSDDLDLGT